MAVVGAGAVGVTAAHDLATAGADVTLFDRGEVGDGATGRAAGVCYDAFAEDVDAAVADRAMARFRALDGAGGFELQDCPYVVVVREGDRAAAEALEASVERMRTHGRDVTVVSPTALGDRFPLRTDDVATAAVAADAGWTDPTTYLDAVGDRAVDAGVDLRTGAEVGVSVGPPGVVVDGATERYDSVLVAAGAHTRPILRAAGVPVAVRPYRVQALTSATPYDGPMWFDATNEVYCRPHPVGLLAGDGTEPVAADPDDWDRAADDWFVSDLRAALRHRADHRLDLAEAWAGLCTATPDGDPLLGEVAPDVYVATGWQGHGFMRAPATGELAAAAMLDASLPAYEPLPVGPRSVFDPGRFDGDEAFQITEGMSLERE